MAEDAMNVDQSEPSKVQCLQTLINGPFASSLSNLSGSSRGIPSNKDFHYYYNFDEFRAPVQEIDTKSQSMLESVGSSSSRVWNKAMAFPVDTEEAYNWLVDVNDEIFERFDMSVDEFQRNRNSEEATGRVTNATSVVDDGFQLVCGKKKKGASQLPSGQDSTSSPGIKVATKDKKITGTKPKIPFHIPSIPRPQQEFKIFVNNVNQPFEHVWLQKSEDGKEYFHPLKQFTYMDFVDKDSDVLHIEPVKPTPVESTPFKFVEEVKDLKDLAAKLRAVNEFAVDLEHNQYRSFQGLTCLIQISTRTEDFVIDALKLRIHIGPYLREVFKDPTKRKVMHGADRDIFWLQRDFGIYICNMFDTGQASRVLKLERNSLEYLLHHFCGVTANKEYQNADWRLRPLPKEMLRYAREDTHYLLHIYDLMRMKLFSLSKESESSDISLQEVYKRSYELCIQLYEKELLTENSYLYIYGLQGAGLNAQQLAIVAGLCEWRDVVARTEDESTGYILPNKTLIEIAKQMPVTTSQLRRLVKSKHPYMEQNLGAVVSIIRSSMLNASAFEAVAEQLKEARVALASEENLVVATVESTSDGNLMDSSEHDKNGLRSSSEHPSGSGSGKSGVLKEDLTISGQREDRNTSTSLPDLAKVSAVTVQVQKKPSRAFGALLGNKISKKKTDASTKDKEEAKLEQIRASVHLPFHSFSSISEQSKPVVEAPVAVSEVPAPDVPANALAASSRLDDIIMLRTDNTDTEESKSEPGTVKDADSSSVVSSLKIDKEEEPMSLSDLSSSFQQCFQDRKAKQVDRTQISGGLQLEPFDYEAARKQVLFGEKNTKEHRKGGVGNSKGKKKSDKSRASNDEELGDFSQGRRRKAFPASGNRSSTFR
ncbi:protein RRP6-like 2 [Humulus lupulus]|uniref:protein RRP6-like 2 n=1 Tax=Humulus lupulus TaxID=3486 RepID=UPI002B402524|nr:protein RRP6-like 2 [Humulus lupulus]